jgi:hypothetical protein
VNVLTVELIVVSEPVVVEVRPAGPSHTTEICPALVSVAALCTQNVMLYKAPGITAMVPEVIVGFTVLEVTGRVRTLAP